MSITVEFASEQEIQRLLALVHRDLARVRGNEVMAQERVTNRLNVKTGGRQIDAARKALLSLPHQREILENAQTALRESLRQVR